MDTLMTDGVRQLRMGLLVAVSISASLFLAFALVVVGGVVLDSDLFQAATSWLAGAGLLYVGWKESNQTRQVAFLAGVLHWGLLGYVDNKPSVLDVLPGLLVPFVALLVSVSTLRRFTFLVTGLMTFWIAGQVLWPTAEVWLLGLAAILVVLSGFTFAPSRLRQHYWIASAGIAFGLVVALFMLQLIHRDTGFVLIGAFLAASISGLLVRDWRLSPALNSWVVARPRT